ncbi:regulator of chromosome condensation 1/beta-lactamase-inhibitor protein II [Hygrophoropsis aurantiaca]|uniref:Regulator of chromosome condensation 1/beta-lactamase-inhibitor protein II n=1 Tax=Hygrophoropsis aurantiaca TaxID=72124 RepID=A0ACB8AFA4_9AGAM|nr:regulator of chromosome condensation 1/beta-lactamase-inhibitor protein II [Hygrophoropsis aurantiaca]
MLLASGSNSHGQLGNGSADDAHRFTTCQFAGCEPGQLPAHTRRIRQIVCGAKHTLLLLERVDQTGDSTSERIELWGCGDGTNEKLGLGFKDGSLARMDPESSSNSNAFQSWEFSVVDMALQLQLAGYGCRLIAAGFETSYVVLSPTTISGPDVVVSMGSNDLGALGAGFDTPAGSHIVSFDTVLADAATLRVHSLFAGPRHVVAEVSSAQDTRLLVSWGACRHGQLGAATVSAYATPHVLRFPVDITVDLATDSIRSCALGEQHTVFLFESGRIVGLGSNRRGQLLGIDTGVSAAAVGCTWKGTYLLTSAGDTRSPRVLATGSNSHGQLGRSESEEGLQPVEFALATNQQFDTLVCGSEHALALTSFHPTLNADIEVHHKPSLSPSTQLWGWGWNEHGNLGLGNTRDVTIPTKIWPPSLSNDHDDSPHVSGLWAGCGTTWIAVS